MSAPTCSELRSRLGVPVGGTASAIRSWLLLEQPGPWPQDVRNAAFAAALPAHRHDLLQRLWNDEQLRPLLIRRPGRQPPAEHPTLIIGSTLADEPWSERLPAAELAGLDLEAVAAGRPGHGEPVDGPLFAVCTNGSVDRCCAVRGRPLAAALASAHPDRTWEVSHVGGCEFAANLLVLPDGVLHGSTSAEDGLRIAGAAVAGRVDLGGLRGRTGTGSWVAAADVALRRELELDRLVDVTVVRERLHPDTVPGEDGPEPAGADVLLQADGSLWRAVVRSVDLGVHTSVCDGPQHLATTRVTSLSRL